MFIIGVFILFRADIVCDVLYLPTFFNNTDNINIMITLKQK